MTTMTGNTIILVSGMEPKESSAADAKQRRSARYNLGAAVELTDVESGRTKVGLVRALGLHGCFVKTEMLFRVGARVALKIAHSGSEFSAIGRVADQTNRGVGVEFIDLASIDRARLEAYLADLVREEKLANFAGLRKKLGMRTGKACEAGDSAKDEGTPKYPWQNAVIDAFKSPVDSLPGKINVAEKAIAARLTDANHADTEEQLALKDALQGLRVLLVGTRPR